TSKDLAKQRGLRQMKAVALAFLLGAAVIYLVTLLTANPDGTTVAWVGYVQAMAEASMVGALADWFAVTALFRRPLGLPIPHTAIIQRKKDALGETLRDFVTAHCLAAESVSAN